MAKEKKGLSTGGLILAGVIGGLTAGVSISGMMLIRRAQLNRELARKKAEDEDVVLIDSGEPIGAVAAITDGGELLLTGDPVQKDYQTGGEATGEANSDTTPADPTITGFRMSEMRGRTRKVIMRRVDAIRLGLMHRIVTP